MKRMNLFTYLNPANEAANTNALENAQELIKFISITHEPVMNNKTLQKMQNNQDERSSYELVKYTIWGFTTFSTINFYIRYRVPLLIDLARKQLQGTSIPIFHLTKQDQMGILVVMEILTGAMSFDVEFAVSIVIYDNYYSKNPIRQKIRLIETNDFVSTTEEFMHFAWSNNHGKYTVSNNINKKSIQLDFFNLMKSIPNLSHFLSSYYTHFCGNVFNSILHLPESFGEVKCFNGYVPSNVLIEPNCNYTKQINLMDFDITNTPDGYIFEKNPKITDNTGQPIIQ